MKWTNGNLYWQVLLNIFRLLWAMLWHNESWRRTLSRAGWAPKGLLAMSSVYLFGALVSSFGPYQVLCLYQDRQLKIRDLVLSSHDRAVRNCPWTMGLWKNYLLALERHGAEHQTVSGSVCTHDKCLAGSGKWEPKWCLMLIHWCHMACMQANLWLGNGIQNGILCLCARVI